MANLLLLCCLFLAAVTIEGQQLSTKFYTKQSGVKLRTIFGSDAIESTSQWNCLNETCPDRSVLPSCTYSFSRTLQQCVGGKADLVRLARNLGIQYISAVKKWTTGIHNKSINTPSNGPAALWLLSDQVKGADLGENDLTMTVEGVQFTANGPRKSNNKYSVFTSTNKAQIQLEKDGKTKLPLTKEFTFATWLNLHKNDAYQAIIDSYLGAPETLREKDNAPHFWTNGTANLILHLERGKHYYHAKTPSRTVNKWNHLAVTYTTNKAQFYYNGKPIPISEKLQAKPTGILQPRFVEIGHRGLKGNMLQGNLACLAIYTRVLDANQIQRLMANCP